jgi:1-acyl-sn-glycerol-3-phosphate acyltransferase
MRKAAVWLAGMVLRLLMKLEVEGLENVPAEGAMILASNHLSNFDVFPMQLATPRPIFFMGKAELFRFAPMGAVLRDFGAFPVYRGEKDAWALRHARKVLEHDQVLGMFPEGRRSRGKGLGIAKTGAATLALEADCPILPMVVTGSHQFLKSFPQRALVHVSFLRPIMPRRSQTPADLTEHLMLTLASALPVDMRGVYANASSKDVDHLH